MSRAVMTLPLHVLELNSNTEMTPPLRIQDLGPNQKIENQGTRSLKNSFTLISN